MIIQIKSSPERSVVYLLAICLNYIGDSIDRCEKIMKMYSCMPAFMEVHITSGSSSSASFSQCVDFSQNRVLIVLIFRIDHTHLSPREIFAEILLLKAM